MNILFVCTGNTCRSPIAEYYLNSLHIKEITATSAGIYAVGEPISENSEKVLRELGIDACSHISRPLSRELIEKSDRIFCMTPSHRATLLSLGVNENKLFLLKEDGVSDPFGGDADTYRKCRDEITTAIDSLFYYEHPEISYLNKADIEEIASLEELCFNDPWSENAISESMKGNNTFLGIKENGHLVCYLSFFESLGEGYINNIATHPEHRKKGLARALLSELIHYAKNAEFSFLSLEVRESNTPAICLYSAFGFKEEGRRKNYYKAPKEDAIILTRRF